MKNINHPENKLFPNFIINSVPAVLVTSVVAICLGIFFVISQSDNKPIERKDAVSYSGAFENYESQRNYCTVCFADGREFSVYPHTESIEFRETMMSLAKGTRLHILVNPNNGYVVEIRTDTEELLNFNVSQEEIDKYDNGYILIGYLICIVGVNLFIYAICLVKRRKENSRHAEKIAKNRDSGADSAAIRHADLSVKNRVLVQASAEGYTICYRRVKSVNELIINGRVYDEKKAIIEFEHKLCANLDGHSFEAGLDENSNSYIRFDGEILEYKKRLI